jgi:hypothetical protein
MEESLAECTIMSVNLVRIPYRFSVSLPYYTPNVKACDVSANQVNGTYDQVSDLKDEGWPYTDDECQSSQCGKASTESETFSIGSGSILKDKGSQRRTQLLSQLKTGSTWRTMMPKQTHLEYRMPILDYTVHTSLYPTLASRLTNQYEINSTFGMQSVAVLIIYSFCSSGDSAMLSMHLKIPVPWMSS